MAIFANMHRCFIWSQLPTWNPYNNKHLSHVFYRFWKHIDKWLHHITQHYQLFLYAVNLGCVNPDRRQNRIPFLFFNTNDDIATTPIMYVIGKCADSVKHIFGILPSLEVETFPFHNLPTYELIDVHW